MKTKTKSKIYELIKLNAVWVIIPLTFSIDHIWTYWNDAPKDMRFIHLDGSEGKKIRSAIWHISNKANIIIFVWMSLQKHNKELLNFSAIWAYIIVSLYNLFEYIYFGVRNDTYIATEWLYFILFGLIASGFLLKNRYGRANK